MDIDGKQKRRRRLTSSAETNNPTTASGGVGRSSMRAGSETKQFTLPRYYAPARPVKVVTRKRVTKKAMFFRVASVCTVLVLLGGGMFAWKAYSQLHKVFRGTDTVAALASKPVTPDLLKGEGDGRVNILLMGIGGPGHDGADLTDTLVVLSVDPVNNTATMLSVPRDLWVKMPVNFFGSKQKINAAYESGKYHYLGKVDASGANANAVEAGFKSVDQVMKEVLDININYHALVNFQAFRQAIDTVGGVTVDVPEPLYDPTMAWENKNNPLLAPAGTQDMNGIKALMYARSRETTSDFARAQRQRQILVALKDKVISAGTLSDPTKIDGLMNAFGDNVYSDLSTQGASRLMTIMRKVSDKQIKSIGLTDQPNKLVTTDRVGSASVVRPVAGFDKYLDIQNYVKSQLPDGYLLKEKAPILVVGKTTAGANATAAQLKTYGYNVVGTELTDQTVLGTVVVNLSKSTKPYTKNYLEKRYDVTPVSSLPPGVKVVNQTAKFVIIGPK